jgi:ABC-2 type transport system permease protein
MVAQFLRLKLQLLRNIFRRSVWQVVGITVGLVYGLGAAVVVFMLLAGLRSSDDVTLVRDVLVVAGSAVVAGFLIVPLVFGVDDTMDPRRFALFGLPDRTLALGLALAAAIGVPALALAIALAGTVVTWSRGVPETLLALISGALAFATCLLAARLTAGLGGLLLETRRAREVGGVIGVLLVVMAAPVLVALSTVDWASSGRQTLGAIGGVLSWTPLGAAFAVPGDAAAGAWGAAVLKLAIAGATVWLAWRAWERLVAKMLVTPGREAAPRSYHGLGWFGRMPQGATGAIAARSITYWFRDARYWVSLVMVPVTPLLVVLPLAIAGVPMTYLGLIPVPLVCLLLGWSLHNDTAYDSTAVWLHLASGVRGVADRIGRLAPVLIAGILVIGLGSAVTVFVLDDWRLLPSARRCCSPDSASGRSPRPGCPTPSSSPATARSSSPSPPARSPPSCSRSRCSARCSSPPPRSSSRASASSSIPPGMRRRSPRASGSASWCSSSACSWADGSSPAAGRRSCRPPSAPERGVESCA